MKAYRIHIPAMFVILWILDSFLYHVQTLDQTVVFSNLSTHTVQCVHCTYVTFPTVYHSKTLNTCQNFIATLPNIFIFYIHTARKSIARPIRREAELWAKTKTKPSTKSHIGPQILSFALSTCEFLKYWEVLRGPLHTKEPMNIDDICPFLSVDIYSLPWT